MDRKKSCNCIRQCPCYPKCDQMMDEGQIPGAIPPSWLRSEIPQNDAGRMDYNAMPQNGAARMDSGAMPQSGAARMDSGAMPQSGTARMDSGAMPQSGAARMDSGAMPQSGTARMGSGAMPQSGAVRMDSGAMPQMGSRLDSSSRVSDDILLEEENERDWQRLKEMYPEIAKIIMVEVERVCDSMEYEGSMMFDTMPDRVRIRMLTDDIYDKVKDRYPVEETNDQDDMFSMNQEGRRRYPPRQNWLGDFIQVLLFQEMHHRRCRHRGCRRW